MFPGSTMASMIHPCLPFPTLVRFPSLILSCHSVSWVNCGQHKEEKNKACEWGPHHLLNHFCLFWVVVAFNFLSCGTSSGGGWGEKKKGGGGNIEFQRLTLLCYEVTFSQGKSFGALNVFDGFGGTVVDWVGFGGRFSNCHLWCHPKVRNELNFFFWMKRN